MNGLSLASLLVLVTTSAYASITDIRTERIPNKALIAALIAAIVLAVLQCGVSPRELLALFALNAASTCLFSLVLFYTNTWAGGDCKLACVLALLYPPTLYWNNGNLPITLPLAVGFAFVFGSLYVIARNLPSTVKNHSQLSFAAMRQKFFTFLQSFACGLAVIGALHLLYELAIAPHYSIDPAVITLIGFCCIWLLASRGLLQSIYLLGALLIIDSVASLITGSDPLGLNPGRCLFVLVIVLFRIVVSEQNYATIPTSGIAEGMILSTASSLLLLNSRIRGLPGVSTENLRSRLTAEEAESVKRWGNSSKGSDTIQVVNKMPFAIFVSLGYITYLVIWGLT